MTRPRSTANVLAAAAIAAAAFAAYSNTFAAPFVLDDHPTIERNLTIRSLWPPSGPLSPPRADDVTASVGGRPFVNLTLAANYAISGLSVWSYHAVNLAIHILAGLALFGVVGRTFSLRDPGIGGAALWPALAVTLVWTLHPLQTESVTYLTQRAESLVGLLYLLTLYCFIHGASSPASLRWYALAVAACALGMASKEVMVSAPLVVWLYDRTFVAGSFGEAWRRRRPLYLGLFATWLLLATLVAGTAGHGGTAGFGSEVAWWEYALTQCEAIAHYLWLVFWPSPLVFDYGMRVVHSPFEVLGQAALLLALLVGTIVALRRRPALGFAGAAFFALLAPSSSVLPIATQTIAEHRMYLPLAAIVTSIVAAARAVFGPRALLLCFVWAAALGWLTFERNRDYRSEYSLWQDTVAKNPASARAHSNLAKALLDAGRTDDAFAHLAESLRLGPPLPAAHFNLGLILTRRGQKAEARQHYEEAVRLNPKYAEAHVNLAVAMMESGDAAGALPHLQIAVALAPDLAEAHCNLANALSMTGRLPEAAAEYAEALRLKPDYAVAHANFGRLLWRMGRLPEAAAHLEEALSIQPDFQSARQALDRLRSAAVSQ